MIGTLISGSVVKGLLAGVTGVLLGCVGVAPGTGTLRFTFNVVELSAGLSQTPGMVGVFALGAQLGIISKGFKAHEDEVQQCKLKGFGMPLADWIKQIPNIIRSALLGIGIGILPGIGGGTSNLIAYGVAKSCSKYPEKFGTGIPDGIVASETSNNASRSDSWTAAVQHQRSFCLRPVHCCVNLHDHDDHCGVFRYACRGENFGRPSLYPAACDPGHLHGWYLHVQ